MDVAAVGCRVGADGQVRRMTGPDGTWHISGDQVELAKMAL
ncbi:hypothetical protein MGWOODY_Clf2934 [hydrothermal vent metagenome]|uniref:Uncharacterized protein n=1 Tax=hydrothermal vent metagenome TaxID=652676 RepID=A0A170QAZ5_9ZZZZ